MVFEFRPTGTLQVVKGYPDGEITAQFRAQIFPDNIYFIAELSPVEVN